MLVLAALAMLSVILTGALPASARDTGAPLELRWSAPAQCPGGAAVRAEVLRLARVGPDASRHLKASGTIVEASGTWQLALTTEFQGMIGERELSASSCRALSDAAALTLALILNPPTEPAERDSRDPDPPRALAVRGQVAGHAGVHAGVLKGVGPEVGGGLGLSIDSLSTWVLVSYGFPQDTYVSGSSGPGGSVWFASGTALACWNFAPAPVQLGACAGGAITRVAGRGHGVTSPRSDATSFPSATAGMTLGVALLSPFVVKISGFALVPLRRPSLFLEDLGQVQRPAVLGGEVRAGAELQFP